MAPQRRRIRKRPALAVLNTGDAELGSFFERRQFRGVLCLALLHKAQTLAQDFTGVLILSRVDEGVDQFFLPICQDHARILRSTG